MKLTFKYLCALVVVLSFSCNKPKSSKLEVQADLPKILKESSGIENLSGMATFWMINDSGNSNDLYEIKESGDITRVVEVINASNEDWEDLATDGKDRLFIGDFGNNSNLRKDLTIYTVAISTINNGEVEAIKTHFYFEDQKKFPPKKKNRNFDVEAFVYMNGHFYLFTKNRSSKFDGTTKLYKVLAQQGEQRAILIGSFVTCKDQSDCLITSAALSKDKKELVLLTHNKLFQFTNFKEDNFFEGVLKETHLNHKTQKEAICFKDGELFITDEAVKNSGGNLYSVKD